MQLNRFENWVNLGCYWFLEAVTLNTPFRLWVCWCFQNSLVGLKNLGLFWASLHLTFSINSWNNGLNILSKRISMKATWSFLPEVCSLWFLFRSHLRKKLIMKLSWYYCNLSEKNASLWHGGMNATLWHGQKNNFSRNVEFYRDSYYIFITC
jgi:hypothetical protein